ncbi:MAG: hypothetical protein H7246_11310, partial [Phycisphaerae bacterium]|nr:hypothetical protein [Saprospiraceae bacterium]
MAQSTPALTLKVVPPSSATQIVLLATLGDGISIKPSIGALIPTNLSDLTDNSFTIPVGFSGRIYFFMSPKNLTPSDLKRMVPTDPASINTKLTSLRYDFVEITYDGTPTASANLSSVDQLGIALSMKALDASKNKIQSVGYKSSLRDIFNVFNPGNKGGAIPDSFTRVLSPLSADESSRPDLSAYLKSLDGKTINLVGNFDGSTDGNKVHHNALPFSYTCNFQHDTVVLKATTVSGIQGNIEIPDLADMIFPCEGAFNVPG